MTNNDAAPVQGALSGQVRAFILLIVGTGAICLINAVGSFDPADKPRFFGFLLAGAFASVLKIHLPNVSGTMSLGFLLVLLAITRLSVGEAVLVGASSALVQYLWHARKPTNPQQLLFNIGNASTATWAAWQVQHATWLHAGGLDWLPVLCLAASVYFVLNSVSVATVIALTEHRSVPQTWLDRYLWSYLYYFMVSVIVAAMWAIERQFGWQTAVLLVPLVYLIYRTYGSHLDRLEREKAHARELAALHLRTVEALALAIEAKDQSTNEHLQRVQVYAQEIGRELGLTEEELKALEAASLLHDIGKLAVPEHILSKPGRLTPEEFDKMKVHPIVGAEILERVQFPYPVVPIVAAHHEKWDGTGYPHGLAGEQIPIGARILSVVDCLDALASDRHYRRALPLDEAMKGVAEQAGKAFDPAIVDVLRRRYRELERKARSASRTSRQRLSTDLRIAPGAVPGAGFQTTHRTSEACTSTSANFLHSIAAARTEVQMLFELSQSIGLSLSAADTIAVLAARLNSLAPHAGLVLWLARGRTLTAEYISGRDAESFAAIQLPFGAGLSGWVAETGRGILNGNPAVESTGAQSPEVVSRLRSAVVVPLDGAVERIGVLSLYHKEQDFYSPEHLRILLAVGAKLGLILENSLRFRETESVATIDSLTGLANCRTLFLHLEAEIAAAERLGQPLALVVGDLDAFRFVNEICGFAEGNKVLRDVADTIRRECRETDFVARVSGDEFAVVLPVTPREAVAGIAERLCAAVAECGRKRLGDVPLTMRAGAAVWIPGARAEDLLSEADRVLQREKQKRNGEKSGLFVVTSKPRLASA